MLRALCAVEAVISQGSSAACGEIAVHFQAGLTLRVYKSSAQLDHAIRSCHPMWILSCIDITVMTTDVVAFHVAQTRTMCVHYHVGSAVTCSEARAYRWL